MNKLRLNEVLRVCPKYSNTLKNGPYKNGNYQRVLIHYIDEKNCMHLYDANKFPREFMERPWYVSKLEPACRSCYNSNANVGLNIYLDKEEN